MRAAKGRDELTDSDPIGVAVVDDWLVKCSCGNRAVSFPGDSSKTSENCRVICRTCLRDLRFRNRGYVHGSLKARVILNSDLLGQLQSEALCALSLARLGGHGDSRDQNEQPKLLSHWASSANTAGASPRRR